MGHQIIKQPDGKLAVFSSVTDSWIICNASPQEMEDYYAGKAAQDARESARRTIQHVLDDEPRKAYYQFTMTVQEADETAREHGNQTLAELLAEADG